MKQRCVFRWYFFAFPLCASFYRVSVHFPPQKSQWTRSKICFVLVLSLRNKRTWFRRIKYLSLWNLFFIPKTIAKVLPDLTLTNLKVLKVLKGIKVYSLFLSELYPRLSYSLISFDCNIPCTRNFLIPYLTFLIQHYFRTSFEGWTSKKKLLFLKYKFLENHLGNADNKK